ncbi:hypothetical protein LTR53_010414 [Teratosphaeriaceae sp. CCFEE 6253]|nr:hypothetical protein LTR53_010414 [Teratosphaeriaceae sp. CCFEE 6253]
MFAPPPLQFSKGEIERLKQEALAKLQEKEKRQSTESAGSSSSSKVASPRSPVSGHQSEPQSPSPKAGRRLFARNSKIKISSPLGQDGPTSPAGESGQDERGAAKTSREVGENVHSPIVFGDSPRRAPKAPRRPARPSADQLPPPIPVLLQPAPAPKHSPPAIPEESPRRRSGGTREQKEARAERPRSVLADAAAVNSAFARLSIAREVGRKFSQPSTPKKQTSTKAKRTSWGSDATKQSPSSAEKKQRLGSVQSGKVGKAPKRANSAATLEATLLELGFSGTTGQRRVTVTEPAIELGSPDAAASDDQTLWKRGRKGETLSMLLDSGFFQEGDASPPIKKGAKPSIRVMLPPPPPGLLDKDLPDTPDSIMSTPTELYQSAPRAALPMVPRNRKPRRTRRSPLAQIKTTSSKSNSGFLPNDVLVSARLSAIPELAGLSENSPPPSSGSRTPTATLIHLRGGSIVTVTPPEIAAWQRHVYIQGPIKLPTPVILPRKNSVASLAPFQDAIDRVYQHALAVPRRRSDDAVVQDICAWIDGFGFEDTSCQIDSMMAEDYGVDDVLEVDQTDIYGVERFSTPPLEQIASPVEKAVAQEAVKMATNKPDAITRPPVPPVENEEILRARGIARLSHQQSAGSTGSSRKESLTLARQPDPVAFAPVPEHGMLLAAASPPPPAQQNDGMRLPGVVVDQGGFDWDEVEEIDEWSTWTSPFASRKKHDAAGRETRSNPVGKMRRLMANASGML